MYIGSLNPGSPSPSLFPRRQLWVVSLQKQGAVEIHQDTEICHGGLQQSDP